MNRIGLIIFMISVTVLSPAISHPEPEGQNNAIKWYRANFPPVTITEGPDAGSGFFDRVTELLIQHMPEYQHHHYTANFKRIITEMKESKDACCPSLYKTKEREEFIAFSIPAVVVLPNAVITRKSLRSEFQPYLDKNNKLALGRLLKETNLRLGISNGRKYSGGIDKVLNQFKHADHISIRSGTDVFKGLLDMLFYKRVEYIIGYPIEASYLLNDQEKSNELQIYFIAENDVDFTIGHVGCPKTEWGEKIIYFVDQILKEYRQTPEYIGYYERWLNDETIPAYREIVKGYFNNTGTDKK